MTPLPPTADTSESPTGFDGGSNEALGGNYDISVLRIISKELQDVCAGSSRPAGRPENSTFNSFRSESDGGNALQMEQLKLSVLLTRLIQCRHENILSIIMQTGSWCVVTV